jgi:DNA polymerase IV
MHAFFVSVEELFDPSLKGKPVVVGGKADQRGVVAAASCAARKFGIHSAMPLRAAARLCPHATFVDGHPNRYPEYSKKVFAILGRFSPQVNDRRQKATVVDSILPENRAADERRSTHT